MLSIEKKTDGSELTVTLSGRLDTTTAPELEGELKDSMDGVSALTIDMAGLGYVSSAGLRVLLTAFKTMRNKGKMKVTNANELVKEVFEVTGFSSFLPIE